MRNYSDPIWTELREGMKRAEIYPYNAPNYGFFLNKGKIEPIPENLNFYRSTFDNCSLRQCAAKQYKFNSIKAGKYDN